jgi:hypothetical protein
MCHLVLISLGLRKLKLLPAYLKNFKVAVSTGRFFDDWSEIDFYLFSCLIGLGLVMGFSGVTVHEHYMIIAYPFVYIWLAKLFIEHKKILVSVLLIQAFITANFLTYIHFNHGSKQGDYGTTYSRQLEQGVTIEIDLRKK